MFDSSLIHSESHILKYSSPISARAFGSAKLSKRSRTSSGPILSRTPHAKHNGVNNENLITWQLVIYIIYSLFSFIYNSSFTFLGILLFGSAPFCNKSLTIFKSPAATAKHSAGYGTQDKDGSAPRLNNNSIIPNNSLKLK